MTLWTWHDGDGNILAGSGNFFIMTDDEYSHTVAEIPVPLHGKPWSKLQAQQHAILLATAPIMMETLLEFQRTIDKDHFYYDRLADTIALAMGKVVHRKARRRVI